MTNSIISRKSLAMAIALMIIVLIAVLCIFASTKPDTFHVERSIAINTTPDNIYPLINDFHEWIKWSPWEKKDPEMKRSCTGSPQGAGAMYAWQGNNTVGQGKMTITESIPFTQIVIALEFLKPFAAQNVAEFTFTPQDDATRVTWTMHGSNNFISKLMQVFMNMDDMVGPDFEDGLQQLKANAEGGS